MEISSAPMHAEMISNADYITMISITIHCWRLSITPVRFDRNHEIASSMRASTFNSSLLPTDLCTRSDSIGSRKSPILSVLQWDLNALTRIRSPFNTACNLLAFDSLLSPFHSDSNSQRISQLVCISIQLYSRRSPKSFRLFLCIAEFLFHKIRPYQIFND